MAVRGDAPPAGDPAGRRLTTGRLTETGGQHSNDADDPARELRRVVARLVALGPERLARPGGAAPSPDSPHGRIQVWLQDLADLTADASASERRLVPTLRPHGVPDQVVVLTRDALAVFADDEPGLAELTRRLVALRRSL